MASASERLRFLIEADAKNAIKAFEATGRAADKELGKAQSKIDKLGGGLTKFGAGAVAAAGVAAVGLFKLADSAEKMALEAGKMADATGLSVEQASRWTEVAGDMGVEAGTVEKSLGFMNKTLGKSPQLFKQYGVEVVKAADGTTDANATFLAVVDRLNAIQDPAKRAEAAAALIGKGWQGMAELIHTGSATLTQSLAEVSDAKVTNDAERANAEKFRASMDALSDSAQDLAISLGQGVAPVIGTIAKGVSVAVGAFGKLDAVTSGAAGQFLGIGTAVLGAAGALSFVTGKVMTAHDRFGKLFDKVGGSSAMFSKLASSTAGLGTALVPVAGAAVALGVASFTLGTQSDAAAERVRNLRDAIEETGSVMDGLTKYINGMVSDNDDLVTAMNAAGVTADDLRAAALAGGPALGALGSKIVAAGKAAGLGEEALGGVLYALQHFRDDTPAAIATAKELDKVMGGGAATAGTYEDSLLDLASALKRGVGAIEDRAKAERTLHDQMLENVQAAFRSQTVAGQTEQADKDAADAVDEYTKSLEDNADALDQAREAAVNRDNAMRAAADTQFAVTDATNSYLQYLQQLPGAITDAAGNQVELNQIYAEGRDHAVSLADAVRDNAVEQYASAGITLTTAAKLDIWNQSMLKTASTAKGPLRDGILAYIAAANDIPPEKLTEIKTLLDQGKVDEAQAALDAISAAKPVAVEVDDATTAADKARGELEAVLDDPLKTKIVIDPSGAVSVLTSVRNQWMSLQRLMNSTVVTGIRPTGAKDVLPGFAAGTKGTPGGAAWGGEDGPEPALLPDGTSVTLGADGPELYDLPKGTIVVPHDKSRGVRPDTPGAPGFAAGTTQNVTHTSAPAEGGTSEDERQANKYDVGDLPLNEYRKYLQGRESSFEKYSKEWTAAHKQIESLNKKEQDDADKLQEDLYDSGEITLAQYKDYLNGRLGALDKHSDEARELWREIQGLEETAKSASSASRSSAVADAAVAQAAADNAIGAAAVAAYVAAHPPTPLPPAMPPATPAPSTTPSADDLEAWANGGWTYDEAGKAYPKAPSPAMVEGIPGATPGIVINVTGALDPPRVAQQISKILSDMSRRNGTTSVLQ